MIVGISSRFGREGQGAGYSPAFQERGCRAFAAATNFHR